MVLKRKGISCNLGGKPALVEAGIWLEDTACFEGEGRSRFHPQFYFATSEIHTNGLGSFVGMNYAFKSEGRAPSEQHWENIAEKH